VNNNKNDQTGAKQSETGQEWAKSPKRGEEGQSFSKVGKVTYLLWELRIAKEYFAVVNIILAMLVRLYAGRHMDEICHLIAREAPPEFLARIFVHMLGSRNEMR
jgi:hypothetical protein